MPQLQNSTGLSFKNQDHNDKQTSGLKHGMLIAQGWQKAPWGGELSLLKL
jgi:hypothetical protein